MVLNLGIEFIIVKMKAFIRILSEYDDSKIEFYISRWSYNNTGRPCPAVISKVVLNC